MRVLVAGAHGQVGQHVTSIVADSSHDSRGMVRSEDQVEDIEALGAEPVVADLTADIGHAVEDCDAIVFAAGSGGDDVWGVDRDGAIRLIEAAERQGVDRFVMLSSLGADTPSMAPEALRDYLNAKAEADERLRESDLTYTIVRPGELTTEEGTGRVRTAADLERKDGDIPREDVACMLVTAIPMESTYDRTFEVLSGDEPIETALEDPL
ncbi:NAD-dependent dehydratase [Halostagnicola sp. A56]|uniref:SDR family oxidoreductase n=1 Tax=Halostagnicola sp. A56 TaxID=1495067 RepID=UPI0004A049B8|nr:SDR family oxidoreductase [Halostagnicola sp. A56]KDE58061.1 NAD-dependent dehydratase [Halostagnicola sp. A56]